MTMHKTETVWQEVFGEWRAECSCGWTGSYLKTRARSQREAVEHARYDEVLTT